MISGVHGRVDEVKSRSNATSRSIYLTRVRGTDGVGRGWGYGSTTVRMEKDETMGQWSISDTTEDEIKDHYNRTVHDLYTAISLVASFAHSDV